MNVKKTLLEDDYDDLMASLVVLITHHSLDKSTETLATIVERFAQLSNHPHIDLFPNQRMVIAKLQNLWKAKLFSHQTKLSNLHAKPVLH